MLHYCSFIDNNSYGKHIKQTTMKKTLLFLLLFIATQAIAGPVDYETAKDIAQKYIGKKSGAKKSIRHKSYAPKRASGTTAPTDPAYYIFDIEENEGFIVVSGEDQLKPILAHTDNGSFNPDSINPAVRWWLNLVEENVAEARKSPQAFAAAITSNNETAVEPLITTKWGQGNPYNLLCPYDPVCNDISITGCCATAMAQVLNYHQYPNKATGTVSYTTYYHSVEISEDLSTYTFDWGNMLNEYTSNYTNEQSLAVAELMRACGVAIESDYCSYTTYGYTTKITEALVDNFGYKGAQMLKRNYFTFNEWENIIKSELNKQRPVIYRGQDAAGGGHLFVCDGYNTDGLFHINWGWDGYQDGYFELTSMNYNSWQYAVCGISPQNTQAPVNLPDIVYEYFKIPEQTTFERSNIYAVYTGIENASIKYSEGHFGLAITKNDEIISYSFDEDFIYSLEAEWSYDRVERYINIPNNVPDGEYKLIPVYKTIGCDEVKKMYCKYANGKADHLVLTLNGNTATISTPDTYEPTALEVTNIEIPEIISNSETIDITFTLKNNTATDFDETFTCSLIVYDDYTHEQSLYANIPANEERLFTVTFTIPGSGNKFGFGIRSNSYWWADNTYIYYNELETLSGIRFEADGIFYSIISEEKKTVMVTFQGDYHYEFTNEYSGEITIPEYVTYEGNTYTVKAIGQHALRNCIGLTKVTIPETVTQIGYCAFYDCTALTNISIGSNVEHIGAYAFRGCNIRTIHIPANTVIIGEYAFVHNNNLQTITISPENPRYSVPAGCNVLVETDSKTLILGAKGAVIPNDITAIGNGAFNGIRGITSIAIPNSVTTIGDYAFDGCSDLEYLTIGSGITEINNTVFANCNALKEIHINDLSAWCNIYFTGQDANPLHYTKEFYVNEEKVTSLVIPNDVTEIKAYAFYNCTGLTNVTIPTSITSIGNEAFLGCYNLKNVYNFSALNIIKGAASHGYVARYADNVISILNGTAEEDFIFDENCILVAYAGNDSEVILPANYKGSNYSIGNNAFRGNTTITSITIPASVTSIGECAFSGCSNLTSIYAESSLPSWLAGDAFAEHYNSATLYVPAGAKAAYTATTPQRDDCEVTIPTTNFNNLQGAIKNRNLEANYETIKIATQNPDVTGILYGADYLLAYTNEKNASKMPSATFGITGTSTGRYKIALVTTPWFIESYNDTVVAADAPKYRKSYLRVKVSQENELKGVFPSDSVKLRSGGYGVLATSAITPDTARIDTIFLKDTDGKDFIFDLTNSGSAYETDYSNSIDVKVELLAPAYKRGSAYMAMNTNHHAFRFLLDQIMLVPVDNKKIVSTVYWSNFANIVEDGAGITGDITGDRIVNVGDVTSIVAMILDTSLSEDAADINNDGIVNVGDVTSLVSIILGN